MLRVIVFLTILFTGTIQAQSNAEADVQKTIETFFEGFHKGDTLMMQSVMKDNFTTQTAFKNREGKSVLVTENSNKLIEAISKRAADQKWDERLLGFQIKVDGNMANAWTPYEFWFNGTFSHCGVNSFQLFNDNGTWKIIYLIDTRRKAGCQD